MIKNDVLISTIDIVDEMKENTSEIINSLKNLNIECSLISGDKKSKCLDVKLSINFKSVYSENYQIKNLKLLKNTI